MTFDEIFAAALAQSKDERFMMREAIEVSLINENPPELSPEWIAELDRRCAEIDAGTVELLSWEEVKVSLDARLNRLREDQRVPLQISDQYEELLAAAEALPTEERISLIEALESSLDRDGVSFHPPEPKFLTKQRPSFDSEK